MENGRVYGHIPGFRPGLLFSSRQELSTVGLHAPTQAGIHGDSSPNGGAFSICLSGGYEDDRDLGDKIIYVGSGGQNAAGEQAAHQSFDDPPNKSLQISCETKRPVRVIRGAKNKDGNHWSPAEGYRYDGLYVVDKFEMRPGKRRYNMCFFELRRIREEDDYNIPYRRLLTPAKMIRMLRESGNR